MPNKKTRRSNTRRHVRIAPDCHNTPDFAKLGRALIAVATNMAKKKRAEDCQNPLDVRRKQSYDVC